MAPKKPTKSKKKGEKGAGTGKGKKKAKKFKAKLSEDAKSRQQEQRAAVEEERRRMREELVNSFLRHKLQKEQALTRLNQSKLIEKWRHVLREAKSHELVKELQLMKLDFDKRFSENNKEIEKLMASLLQSRIDFVSLSTTHKSVMDTNYGDHVSRLTVLDTLYEQERNSIEDGMEKDHQRAIECHGCEKSVLLEAVSALQDHYRESFRAQQARFQMRKDDVINQGLEEEQTLRQLLERRLGHKWQLLHESCVENGELDERRWTLYNKLKAKETVAVAQQRAVAARLDQLNCLMAEMQLRDGRDEEAELRERQKALHDRRERWRLKLIQQQHRHEERLRAAAASSSEVAEHLEQLAKQGLGILRSAQRCSLLKPSPALERTQSRASGPSAVAEPFQHFWSRFNNAYLEMLLLQRHKESIVRQKTVEASKYRQANELPSRWMILGTALALHAEK